MLLKKGSKGSDVKFLQQILIQKGFLKGDADGIFGTLTEKAVKEFQAANKLVSDGIVGDKTWTALNAGVKDEYNYTLINKATQHQRQITHLFVHCTAGNQNATPKELLNFFYNTKKWSRPGYHYVVSKDGTVTQLWPEEKYSNGVVGKNMNSINVAWIGGIDKQHPNGIDNRTAAQKASLKKVMQELKHKYPQAKIMGHRDVPGVHKACPCFDAMVEYSML